MTPLFSNNNNRIAWLTTTILLSNFIFIVCILNLSTGFLIGNPIMKHHRHHHHHYHHFQQRYYQRFFFLSATSKTTTSTSTESKTTDNDDSNKVIDGKAIAATIRQELKDEITQMKNDGHQQIPGLAVILVGNRRDSQTYVNMKKKACEQVGIVSFGYHMEDSEATTESEILNLIEELNQRSDVHGILVQLPLPNHINEQKILNSIDPKKDVDGLHPTNVAKLVLQGGTRINSNLVQQQQQQQQASSFSIPCTPLGCIELLDRSGVEIAGKHAAVIGRSNLVGLPVSFLLLHRDATVTMVHSKTNNIEEEVSRADIVIAAVGKANLVKKSWLKEGAVVIDVGINSIDIPPDQIQEGKRPYKLVGDVDYKSAFEICSKITPVPGGVGPMTIAMLLRNTLHACQRLQNES